MTQQHGCTKRECVHVLSADGKHLARLHKGGTLGLRLTGRLQTRVSSSQGANKHHFHREPRLPTITNFHRVSTYSNITITGCQQIHQCHLHRVPTNTIFHGCLKLQTVTGSLQIWKENNLYMVLTRMSSWQGAYKYLLIWSPSQGGYKHEHRLHRAPTNT